MPELILKKKVFLLNALLFLILAIGSYQARSLIQAYDELVNVFSVGKERVIARMSSRPTIRIVGPPDKKVEITELDMGAGKHQLVVSRNGTTREYTMHREIWSEYMEIGGVESVLGSPTSNEYTWFDGKRQDFERDHWLYWNEKTGVKMDYTPYCPEETTLQEPSFLFHNKLQ